MEGVKRASDFCLRIDRRVSWAVLRGIVGSGWLGVRRKDE
jgi:hypothetical protein